MRVGRRLQGLGGGNFSQMLDHHTINRFNAQDFLFPRELDLNSNRGRSAGGVWVGDTSNVGFVLFHLVLGPGIVVR